MRQAEKLSLDYDVRQQLGVEVSHDPCAQEAATHNRSEFAKVMKLATGKE